MAKVKSKAIEMTPRRKFDRFASPTVALFAPTVLHGINGICMGMEVFTELPPVIVLN